MTSNPKLVISRSLIPYKGMYNGIRCITEWAVNDKEWIKKSYLHEVYPFEKFVLDTSMHRNIGVLSLSRSGHDVIRVLNNIINTHDWLMNIKLPEPIHPNVLAYVIDCVNDELDHLAQKHSHEHFATPGVVKIFSDDKILIGAIPGEGVW